MGAAKCTCTDISSTKHYLATTRKETRGLRLGPQPHKPNNPPAEADSATTRPGSSMAPRLPGWAGTSAVSREPRANVVLVHGKFGFPLGRHIAGIRESISHLAGPFRLALDKAPSIDGPAALLPCCPATTAPPCPRSHCHCKCHPLALAPAPDCSWTLPLPCLRSCPGHSPSSIPILPTATNLPPSSPSPPLRNRRAPLRSGNYEQHLLCPRHLTAPRLASRLGL